MAHAIAALVGACAAHAQSCTPYWTRTSHAFISSNVAEKSLLAFDDGSGTALYLGGVVAFNGGPPAVRSVARWDGRGWTDLAAGLTPGTVVSGPWLAVLDDGQGPRLYAYSGYVSPTVPNGSYWTAVWSGNSWQPGPILVPDQSTGPRLSADLGDGMAIFGLRSSPGGQTSALVKWNGSDWVIQGGVVEGSIRDAIAFDDGTGPAIFIVGGFSVAGGTPLGEGGIAKWNGHQWSDVGGGVAIDVFSSESDLCVYDDGTGPGLYVAGAGIEAGGVAVRNIARWSGHQWSDVGGGVVAPAGYPELVKALGVFDDGNGPALYVAGSFRWAGGVPASDIARWNGHAWSSLGSGLGYYDVEALAPYQDPRGLSLFVADVRAMGDGSYTAGLAQWVGCPNCYANCDNSTRPPTLNVLDFLCFINKFAARDPYANCNVDATIDVSDFLCFLNKFAAGCP